MIIFGSLANYGSCTKARVTYVLDKTTYFCYASFSQLMTSNQFEQLCKILHLRDSENEDPMNSLKKLRFFLAYLIARYKESYTPEEHLLIDEY